MGQWSKPWGCRYHPVRYLIALSGTTHRSIVHCYLFPWQPIYLPITLYKQLSPFLSKPTQSKCNNTLRPCDLDRGRTAIGWRDSKVSFFVKDNMYVTEGYLVPFAPEAKSLVSIWKKMSIGLSVVMVMICDVSAPLNMHVWGGAYCVNSCSRGSGSQRLGPSSFHAMTVLSHAASLAQAFCLKYFYFYLCKINYNCH